jgi:hypothetical protein
LPVTHLVQLDAEPESQDDVILLLTVPHTGTHFVRLLLELHPAISFWRVGSQNVQGRTLRDWEHLVSLGVLAPAALREMLRQAAPNDPTWTILQAEQQGITLPTKDPSRVLFHAHLGVHDRPPAGFRLVTTVRDPLLSVITSLRRYGRFGPAGPLAGWTSLANWPREACFWFCTDLWASDGRHREALRLFEFLGLEPTAQIEQLVESWPPINATGPGNQMATVDRRFEEAKEMASRSNPALHPVMRPWVDSLRATGIQPRLEELGYRRLAWFE